MSAAPVAARRLERSSFADQTAPPWPSSALAHVPSTELRRIAERSCAAERKEAPSCRG